MTKLKDKSLEELSPEELQKLRIQSEIDKNDAERREAEKRTEEIEKRLNRKWYVTYDSNMSWYHDFVLVSYMQRHFTIS